MKKNISHLKITDHALIRYIERILDVSLEPIRKQILDSGIEKMHKAMGDGKYPVQDCIMVVKEGNITTTYKTQKRNNKRHKRNGKYSRKYHERKFGTTNSPGHENQTDFTN